MPTAEVKMTLPLVIVERIVLDEPIFQGVNLKQNNWSRAKLYDQSVKRGIKMDELARRHGWDPTERGIADEFVYFICKNQISKFLFDKTT